MQSQRALHYPEPPPAGAGWVLRPWRADDADDVLVACTDQRTQRFIPELPRAYTREDAAGFIARSDDNLRQGRAIGMAISRPDDGRAIGSITLHTSEPWHWYIGYWMTPAARGQGIASAATHAFSRWAFTEHPSLIRLSLFTLPQNVASQHVAERAGFTREGVLRSWDDAGGAPRDIVMFSLVRADLEGST